MTVAHASSDSFRIISKIDCPIFNPFEGRGIMMKSVKHAILPVRPRRRTKRARRLLRLELIPIMRIFNKELHMSIDMHMDDNRRIVYNIVMEIFEIAGLKTEGCDATDERFLSDPV